MPIHPFSPQQPVVGRILCVEDDEVSYLLVAAIFEAHLPAVTLQRAGTAAEAIRLARAFKPNLMLLDLRLPDRSGLEVIRELNLEISSGAIDVLVVTANKTTTEAVKARALGAVDVLIKPIHLGQFLDAIMSILANRASTAG